ncbi:MAG TPA: hypothetical protein VHB21_13330, partial [Minicystis sp.]|nr:hypothetical protein [Minicystis sp.]
IAAVAFLCAPAAVMASNSSWGIVTGWDQGDHVVSALDHLWTQVELHHDIDTVHRAFIGDIQQLPPPCRGIAVRWDIAVLQEAAHPTHDYTTRFERMLRQMANHQCKITFTTNGQSGGVNNLGEVGPSQ